jgi:hypothetical protein
LVSDSRTLYASSGLRAASARQLTLLDLLDRLLAGGVVVRGQIMLAAADIDLVELDLGLMIASVGGAVGR